MILHISLCLIFSQTKLKIDFCMLTQWWWVFVQMLNSTHRCKVPRRELADNKSWEWLSSFKKKGRKKEKVHLKRFKSSLLCTHQLPIECTCVGTSVSLQQHVSASLPMGQFTFHSYLINSVQDVAFIITYSWSHQKMAVKPFLTVSRTRHSNRDLYHTEAGWYLP